MSAENQVTTAGPDAHHQQLDLIVRRHAQGHDMLDTYGVPRSDGSLELNIAERIKRLYLAYAPRSLAVALAEALQSVRDEARAEAKRFPTAVWPPSIARMCNVPLSKARDAGLLGDGS